jgi:D-alanyl-D-alanine-carboxypeptidase/D-alanyl-D-alanine-endopeptidase
MKKPHSVFIVAILVAIAISTSCTSSAPTEAPLAPTIPSTNTAVAASPSPAATVTPQPTVCPGNSELIPESTKSTVHAVVDRGDTVGIVLGIMTPCGSEVYSYGTTTLSGERAVNEETVFEIGSVGKLFTALLLADMVERGDVAFDDPIELYLPSSVKAPTYMGQSITLIDLATHTSGLPSLPDNLNPADELNPYADYTVAQMYEALAQTTLTRKPGSQYEYSNFGMGLLGHILSLRASMSYEELVVTRVADELGMPSTRVTLTPEMQDRLAAGYRGGEPFPLWDLPTLAGAGALRSTVRDLLTFLAANLGLQESRLYTAMQVTHEPRYPAGSGLQVGMAWHTLTRNGLPIVEQHGATGGYWSYVGFIQEQRTGVAMLTNTYLNIDWIAHGLLETRSAQP